VPIFLADHNFREEILDGLGRHLPSFDVRRLRELGLAAASDEEILEFAAHERLVVLTHDAATLVPAAWHRVERGVPMEGVALIRWLMPVGTAVRLLSEAISTMPDQDWGGRVHYFAVGSR
jgi:hypothetical protein